MLLASLSSRLTQEFGLSIFDIDDFLRKLSRIDQKMSVFGRGFDNVSLKIEILN